MRIRNRNGYAAHIDGIGVIKPGQVVDVSKSAGQAVLLGNGWELVEDDPKPARKTKKDGDS